MSESRRSSNRRRRESGQTGYTTCKASIISFDGQLVNHGCLRTKLAEHTDVSAFSRRELEGQNEQLQGQVEQLQGQVLEQGRLLRLTHSSSSHPPAAGVAATAVRSTGKARTGVIEAPDPRQQPQLLITATRSRPALGNVQGTGTTLAPTDDDEVHSGGSGAGVPVPQPWQPDAITLTIRQWWESLEERLQNALDADDLGVYASRDSRGIGEQQSGREWWVMFSSYSESDMKELFYKEGTVLHDGHTCGRDEVKLRMKDRKMYAINPSQSTRFLSSPSLSLSLSLFLSLSLSLSLCARARVATSS
jgi:hypothetical protein